MDDDLKRVKLTFHRTGQRGSPVQECETWLTMLEQLLAAHYEGYKIIITRDSYNSRTEVEIEFASVDDAVWFKLQRHE